ncbi:hypothetical protein CKAN_02705500 [Cinnamomum micranthum f. kanehirae]|uniref:Uncharacterized protein n=1 Tax=Cinnamomum micranthum f. kanehirae TaxID=337451 RepID=A0A3S3RA07_9MAGN|nr:hypothetical protein CKAN_02705500 [Cinnamomum micranthum f. kanehirae]
MFWNNVITLHQDWLNTDKQQACLQLSDGDNGPKYSNFQGLSEAKSQEEQADRANLWMDQPFLGLIHQYHGDPLLDLLSEEDPLFDLFSEEDSPLDLVTSWLKASCGTLEEDPTLGRPTGQELHED